MQVNGIGIARRSRRRRTTFALFGRPRRRPEALAPPVEAAVIGEDPLSGGVAGLNGREQRAPKREPDEHNQNELPAVVARLQRESRSDGRLLARMPAAELDQLIEETARSLWEESRVTAFVPLLAMRRVREVLGLSEETDASGIESHDADA